jgi:RNA polymerase sigma-70 factor (ECF subfamily)
MACIQFLPRPVYRNLPEPDEASIVADLKACSDEAYSWLVREFRPPILSLIRRVVAGRTDTSDAAQETFLKIFRGMQHFQGGSSLKTWIHRVALREAFNQVRWWSRHAARDRSIDSLSNVRERMVDVKASPLDDMMLKQIRAVVRLELSRVPEPYRTAVILRDIEGLSYGEIARITGVPIGSVSSRLARGRSVLRDRLGQMSIGIVDDGASNSRSEPASETTKPHRKEA